MKDWQLLERVLAAKDARAASRDAEVRRATAGGLPLAIGELSLNVPGWPKLGRAWAVVFTRGLRAFLVEAGASGRGAELLSLRADEAGYWAVLGGPSSAETYKAISCRVEEGSPWGRLLDFDWYAPGGAKIARESLGFPSRTCLVCGGAQGDCISTSRHPLSAVRERAVTLARAARKTLTPIEAPHAP